VAKGDNTPRATSDRFNWSFSQSKLNLIPQLVAAQTISRAARCYVGAKSNRRHKDFQANK
jgi:hypothetical protein